MSVNRVEYESTNSLLSAQVIQAISVYELSLRQTVNVLINYPVRIYASVIHTSAS